MRQSSLMLASSAPPRAPSPALLSVLWATLAAIAFAGIHQATRAPDVTPRLGIGALPPSSQFNEGFSQLNADGKLVRFGTFTDASSLHNAAIEVGDDFLALPMEFDSGSFAQLLISPDGQKWLAVEEFDTEAMGDLQFVGSDDGGRTFVHRGTFSWPTYLASPDKVTFDGQHVDVQLSLDEDAQLSVDAYGWLDRMRVKLWGDARRPTLAAGTYHATSSDAGRSFGALRRL